MNLHNTGADLISLSSHKIHGPKGVGALYIRKARQPAGFHGWGAGREKHRRSGTENVPAIVGFGEASRLAEQRFDQGCPPWRWRDVVCSTVLETRSVTFGSTALERRKASVLNVSFLGCRGRGPAPHPGTGRYLLVHRVPPAPPTKRKEPRAGRLGLSDKKVEGAIRFSFSEFNTPEEMDYVTE